MRTPTPGLTLKTILLKVWFMNAGQTFRPTLWRTCRALANRPRLRMLAWLFDNPGQTVSALAAHASLSLSTTSLHLRALESRGLLEVRRSGRNVIYRARTHSGHGDLTGLLTALRRAFRHNPDAVEALFKLATAFTHPRRVEIVRMLAKGPLNSFQLGAAARIPLTSTQRHLSKLLDRGFLEAEKFTYRLNPHLDGVRRELIGLALTDTTAI